MRDNSGIRAKWQKENKHWKRNAFINGTNRVDLWQGKTNNSFDKPSTPRGHRRQNKKGGTK